MAQQIAVELVNNKDFNAVGQKFGAEIKDTPLMEQGQPIPELGNASELQRRMFTMAKGEIGTAIQVERGYVIPMLAEIAAGHPASGGSLYRYEAHNTAAPGPIPRLTRERHPRQRAKGEIASTGPGP